MKKLNYNPFSEDGPKKNPNAVSAATRQKTAVDELEEGPARVATLTHPGYGGITVRNATTGTEAIVRVLGFLVDHRGQLGDLLADHGIVLLQLKEFPSDGFCVRRSEDGWTLAVPAARERGQAMLQIIQALLAVARGNLGGALRQAHITPYRE